ncbi:MULTISPECIES: GMC family oxidoreductase [Dinoroseobacter]|jgi:choline dehydrogenase|nr:MULTISPECIES: GMC family oxidoreductase N-terminal domain-containing protein [Dinoroseobacter]URF48096.1 GMC family oxidoreductase N-terminal domain-containing protein [Dinoroseobacter shibae]URF52406.1 GMC family oxidoreductase N-terminal domain-containing protein [Dinoroseobacter shibae]
MGYFRSAGHGALERAVFDYRQGAMSRRDFLRRAMALGATAGMAGALATAWSGTAIAQSSTTAPQPDGEYDFIVIGTGSAGAACVYQLAQTGARILVLEAGRNDDLEEVHDSRLWAASLGTDATKWFETLPSSHTDGRNHMWPRGNVLGGTSALNAMVYARGHRTDFDVWETMGATGWSYEDVLPHFMAMESYEPGGENRGTSGPIFVSQPQDPHRHEGAVAFMDAAAGLGYKETPSFNSDRMSGQAWIDFNIKDQRRQSSAVAFLRPAIENGNITLLTDAPVQKLTLEGTKCTGVTYLHNGAPVSVRAANEVILSAGAIDSPRLLMLSGIGIASDLRQVGIDAVVDLPVGVGLQDHILGAGVNYEAKGPVPVSHYNHSEVYMWERSDPGLRSPDMIALYVSVPFASTGHKLDYEHGYCILSGVATPQSRGYVKLASDDIADAPIIETNYLAEEQDWKSYRAATELCRELGASDAYAEFRKRESLPQKDGELTDAEWRDFLSASVNTYFHPTSTCQIGKVVEPDLRVKGIEGLRVADASVMPQITTSNTNAPTMMIGWRAGDMISKAT